MAKVLVLPGGRVGVVPKASRMNKTEAAYADTLEAMRLNGGIKAWKFEAVKLRLATLTWYTPDFLVVMPDGAMEFHEVKGFWRDDARVKIKVAAEQYPMFRFLAVRRQSGCWVPTLF